MPIPALLGRRTLLPSSTSTTAIHIDGNSIGAGFRSAAGSGWGNSILATLPPINSAVTLTNTSTSGQTLEMMAVTGATVGGTGAGFADVTAAHVAGKTNVLIVLEIINSIIFGDTPAQAIAALQAYINAVKNANDWRVVVMTGPPCYQDPSSYSGVYSTISALNQAIVETNDILRANFKSMGIDQVADLSAPGSPFLMTDYTVLANYSNTYFSTADGADIRVHWTNAGYQWAAENAIAPALARLRV